MLPFLHIAPHKKIMNMKRILLVLMLFASLCLSAKNEKALQTVTMVDYEQRWLDHEGTLALRNNTDNTIRRVKFRITYLDMNGTPLDYRDFSESVDIAPGMTKKVDVEAYEHSRFYSYYKSEGNSDGKKFKIKFQLSGYDYDAEAAADTLSNDYENLASAYYGGLTTFAVTGILLLILFIGVYVGMYILVACMARNRFRDPAVWVLVSIFATPLLVIVILLALGKDYNSREYMERERTRRDADGRWEDEESEDGER